MDILEMSYIVYIFFVVMRIIHVLTAHYMYPDMRIICPVSMIISSVFHSITMRGTYAKLRRCFLSVYRYIVCDIIIECCLSTFSRHIFHPWHIDIVKLIPVCYIKKAQIMHLFTLYVYQNI